MAHASGWSRTGCRHAGRRLIGVLVILVLTLSVEAARGQPPQSAPRPAGVSATSLAHYVPRRDLGLYLEFQGLDSAVRGSRGSAAYKALNETKLGVLLEDLARQGIELAQQSAPGEKQVDASSVIEMFKFATRQGLVIGAWNMDTAKTGVVFVFRHGERPDVRRLLEGAAASNLGRVGEEADRKPIQQAGRTLYRLDKDGVWWFEKGDLVLSNQPDVVLAVLDGKSPSAVDHPRRAALLAARDGFQPVLAGFVDMSELKTMPAEAIQLGLDGVKQIEIQWGFQDDALVSVLGVVAPAAEGHAGPA